MASSTDAAPSTVEAELEELQRRYRMMESDRKAYSDEVQNVVRKQKSQIDKLKRENGQLKQELQLQSRAGISPDGSVGSTRVTRLQDATDTITRSIETEKKRTDEIEVKTKALRDGILQERRDMGGNNAPQEQNQAIGKQVKVLEHRLHRALIKFNEAIAANKDLREEIDNLRRERVVFDGIYKKLQHELAEKKKRMAEIIEVANVAYEARDRAQAEITSLKLQSEKEQTDFEGEWKELGRKLEEDRKRQDFLARERQRLLQLEQRGEMSVEDEKELKKLVTKGHWGLAKDKANIHVGMEKVQSYEEAFAKMQAATGISDIDQLVKQFIENEDRNFKMFNYLNELNGEIEKGEEGIAELKVETEKYRGQDKGAASQRKRLIKELQDRAMECESRSGQFEEAFKALAGSIGQISRTIEALCSKLGCNTKLLQEMGTEQGCNEANIMVYLGLVEQRANELLSSYLSLQHHGHTGGAPWQQSGGHESNPSGLLVGPNTPQGMSTVQITVPTTSEEYESEESEEEEEHPLTRDELQAKTMRGLAKREVSTKKGGKAKGGRK